jgi:translocation and assembly module TamA
LSSLWWHLGVVMSLGLALCLPCGVSLAQMTEAPPRPLVAEGGADALAADAAADAASGSVAARTPLVWRLDIQAPEPLDALLRNYLDLARFQAESALDGSVQIGRSELRRLVVSAPEQARALIEAEGYFSARIVTRVSDELPGEPVVVTITVEPGEQTEVSKVQFIFEGQLDERLSGDDAGLAAQARALVDALSLGWGLPEGEVFRQADWSSAKNAALARLRADGYPAASWSGTSATVDADARTAKLYLVADTGPAFAFGDIRIEGLQRQPASAIVNLAPFKKGDPYKEKQLLDWQERIQKLNLFESIFVTADLDPTQAATTPVLVQVHEQPLQIATAGIGMSSDTGPRVSGDYLHRNVWGLGWQAKTTLQLGRASSNAQIDFTSHPWPGRRRGLVSTQASYVVDDAKAVTTSQRLRVGQLREGDRLERTDYIEFQQAKVRSPDKVVVSQASAVSATSQWIFRDVDNQVLPTTGSTSIGQLTGGRSYSALDEPGFFGRASARVTWYTPLPWHWYATVRGELGQVFARDAVSVPDTLLFRAGGDESVRGYAYRSLGVVKEGVTIGGRAMFTTSFEVVHGLLASQPNLQGALFVDAGDAASRFGNLEPKVGVGAGVRYRSPVGPLKLDLAYGTQVREWRIHFSVGVSL